MHTGHGAMEISLISQTGTRGEPNDLEKEHCGEILKGLRFWNNKECDGNQAWTWICEKPRNAKTSPKTVQKIPPMPGI